MKTYALHTERVTIAAHGERANEVASFVCAALTLQQEASSLHAPTVQHEANVHHEAGVAKPTAAHPSISLSGDGPFVMTVDGVSESLDTSVAAAEALMRAMTVKIMWGYRHGMAIHSAALLGRRGALLFPALSGSGKSTLSVDFAARGMPFLTDELVFVPSGTTNACAWARPAHTKPGSRFIADSHKLPAWRGLDGDLFACGALNGPIDASLPRPIFAVIAPQYVPGAATELTRLSAGETTAVLLSALLNARNLDGIGVPAAAGLARSVEGYRLRYGNLASAFTELAR